MTTGKLTHNAPHKSTITQVIPKDIEMHMFAAGFINVC